jgi:hypothetical protein
VLGAAALRLADEDALQGIHSSVPSQYFVTYLDADASRLASLLLPYVPHGYAAVVAPRDPGASAPI